MSPSIVEPEDRIEHADLVPRRGVIRCYRVILWIVPGGIAFASALAVGFVLRWLSPSNYLVADIWILPIWLLLNGASTLALGWCDAKLRKRGVLPVEFSKVEHAVFFAVSQVIILLCLGVTAMALIGAIS